MRAPQVGDQSVPHRGVGVEPFAPAQLHRRAAVPFAAALGAAVDAVPGFVDEHARLRRLRQQRVDEARRHVQRVDEVRRPARHALDEHHRVPAALRQFVAPQAAELRLLRVAVLRRLVAFAPLRSERRADLHLLAEPEGARALVLLARGEHAGDEVGDVGVEAVADVEGVDPAVRRRGRSGGLLRLRDGCDGQQRRDKARSGRVHGLLCAGARRTGHHGAVAGAGQRPLVPRVPRQRLDGGVAAHG